MKILIAEDDKVSRDLLRQILSTDRSYEIKEAVDGVAAWNMLDQGLRPDLCILDIMMPDLDGLELLKRIREDQRLKQVSVILCTALNDRTTVTQAAALSVNYFILKPYSTKTVLAQVQKMKQRLAVSRRLESSSVVCERLEIDLPTYLKLLGAVAEEVPAVVQSIERGTAHGDLKSPLFKLNAVKGAALNLGANGLVGVLSALEIELINDAPSPSAPEPERTEQLCKWAAAHHKRILDQLGTLKAENEFLASEIERHGGPAAARTNEPAPSDPKSEGTIAP